MTQTPPPPPSPRWCLFLDVDGTLIELCDTPFDTVAGDDLKSLLQAVSARLGGAVALVSGRSIETLDRLFDPLRLPSAGLHGVERRSAAGGQAGARGAGNTQDTAGTDAVDVRLDQARIALQELVDAHPGTLLEDKGRTVAVHYRLSPRDEPAVREAVKAVAAALGDDYHVQGGNMMFELKPRGFSKGAAIEAFLREPPFAGRTPVFAGDDFTDQDGFRAVDAHGGISIAVGDRVQARCHLDDPAAVRRWLSGIAALDTQ